MPEAAKFPNLRLMFFAVFMLGIGLRFAQLGSVPLSESEAHNALAALGLAEGGAGQSFGGSAYVFLTALLFQFFASSEFLARFWPAVFGSLLVLLPFAFQKQMGQKAALIAGLALAIAPPLVAASRQADSTAIGLAALGAAILFLSKERSIWLGAMLAVTLMSGPGIIFGLFTFFLAITLIALFSKSSQMALWRDGLWGRWKNSIDRKALLVGFSVALLVGATSFLRQSQGIAALGESLALFLRGWRQAEQLSGSQFLLALMVYGWPILLMALIGFTRNWKSNPPLHKLLAIWSALALILLLLYPGRSAEAIIWVLLPALYLAALELKRSLLIPSEGQIAFIGALFLLLVLAAFQLVNLAAIGNTDPLGDVYGQRLIIAGGVLLLALVAMILIAGGWSKEIALSSLYWGYAIVALLFFFAQSAQIGRDIFRSANELWQSAQSGGQVFLLGATLDELSDLNYGREKELDVAVLTASDALQWLLRDWPKARFSSALSTNATPDVIISDSKVGEPRQSAAYRGQDFALSFTLNWEESWPPNLFGWILFKDAPLRPANVALWAREDLFPQPFEESSLDIAGSEAVPLIEADN